MRIRLTVAGDANFGGDLLAGPTLAAQGFDLFDNRRRRRSVQAMRPRRAIAQPLDAFGFVAGDPLAHRSRADACGSYGGLRRLPALDPAHHHLSTARRQTGILMDVHPVLLGL